MSDESERLPMWCAGEDWCAITATASLVGKKWHPVIVHRLIVSGPLGFNALKEEVDGISSKVLSDSLDDLGEKRLVNREIVNDKPVRVEYSLTPTGKSLKPVILSMRDWGLEYLTPADGPDSALV